MGYRYWSEGSNRLVVMWRSVRQCSNESEEMREERVEE